jgi:uncharacterized membrane protein YkoI
MIAKRVSYLCVLLCAAAFSVAQAAPSKAQLVAQARVKESEARKIALKKVASGSIKSVEIEKEKGRLVWSFDISKPHTRNITEVLVDAKAGTIVSISEENSAQQAAEAKADKLQH